VANLCHRLRETVDVIGLNVRTDNQAARGLYTSLGFVSTVDFEQGMFATATEWHHHVPRTTQGRGGTPPVTR
jgi:catechol-2,3-dioxygenase